MMIKTKYFLIRSLFIQFQLLPCIHVPDLLAVNRGSNMSAHVLLNLLNKLRKSDKMRGLPSILLFFRNEFNKFNNTGALMLDSIYLMPSKTA